MESKKDILLYISDQHAGPCLGAMGDPIACTPNLDVLAEGGALFTNAYTSCPLCVPARASLMTSRLPSNLGVFDNACDYKSSEITFAHMFEIAGYDTTLIGRMHFMGLDYHHGFGKRLACDFSPSYWGNPSENRKDMGVFGRSLYQKWCLEVIGSGDSPVLDYDRRIVSETLDFLSQDLETPQLTVVGTYGPHFPYVADENLMEKYRERISASFRRDTSRFESSPCYNKTQQATDARIIEVRAAYYALIETMDTQIGEVYSAFQESLARRHREGIFIYLSDHGDQIGYKNMYGKQTFFEYSAKIPLIVSAPGQTPQKISSNVSIMDIGPTLCDLAGIEHNPMEEGTSFAGLLEGKEEERTLVSEFYDTVDAKVVRGCMLLRDGFKLITYAGAEDQDLLFDMRKDPAETINIRESCPGQYQKMMEILKGLEYLSDESKLYLENKQKHAVLARYGAEKTYLNQFSYVVPSAVRNLDTRFVE